jgi:hypothetical protein
MDKNELSNAVYKAVLGICEGVENDKTYLGNGHHLAQKITEKVVLAVGGNRRGRERGVMGTAESQDIWNWLEDGERKGIVRKLSGEPLICDASPCEISTVMGKIHTLRLDYQGVLKEETRKSGVLQSVEVNLYQCPTCKAIKVAEEYCD